MATTFKTPFGMNPNKTNAPIDQGINITAVDINANQPDYEIEES